MMKRPEYVAAAAVLLAVTLVVGTRTCSRRERAIAEQPTNAVAVAPITLASPLTNAEPAPVAEFIAPEELAKPAAAASLVEDRGPYVSDEIILRTADGATLARLEALLREHGMIVVRRVDPLQLIRVKLPEGMRYSDAQNILSNVDAIAERMPNVKTELPTPVTVIPPLPSGELPRGVMAFGRHLIGAENLPADDTLGRGVIIAVLDTGVDASHPDLAERVLSGYNFVDDNMDTRDVHGHGTACAGIMVGAGKSAGSVRGVADGAYIMPVKVMRDDGGGNAFTVVEGIIYAVSRGAKVLNLSIGTLSDSAIVHDAIRYAVDHGVTVVAASGNDGQNTVLRPAAYDEVICVGAVDGDLDRAQFSNYGDEVDIVAPGVGVATAGLAGRRIYFSGTSAAAPFVSGALAALRARFPQLSVAELRARLLDNANTLGAAGRDPYFGAGILRLDRAMRSTFDRVNDLAVTSLYFDPPAPRHGEHVTVYFVVQNQGTESITGAQWRDSIDGARSSMTLPMLKPGACYEIRRSWTVPPLIGDGGARIEGTVRCSATETSLRNNGKAITLYNPAQ